MTNWSKEDIQRVTLDDFVNMTLADMIKGKKLETGKQKADAGLNEGAIFTAAREALKGPIKRQRKMSEKKILLTLQTRNEDMEKETKPEWITHEQWEAVPSIGWWENNKKERNISHNPSR